MFWWKWKNSLIIYPIRNRHIFTSTYVHSQLFFKLLYFSKFYVALRSIKMLFTTNQRKVKDLQGKLKAWSWGTWENINCDTKNKSYNTTINMMKIYIYIYIYIYTFKCIYINLYSLLYTFIYIYIYIYICICICIYINDIYLIDICI